ncbi:ParH-like protein [Streptomyces sp. BE20]|uniref:ParH-like protein n=1 Tax=unclassified Streptomyces TaxID=2593676 RepID=UPI002E76E6EA|nr:MULTISPECIES: ParH-like protein [unclassified Streptomyces]MED7948974.1 ParH-like protein [Streptomyces sp. BE303]MEE1825279.1 ParH-like protein [Streptomyces sp. BE20]
MGHSRGVDHELWQRCRGIAESIPLPEPFGITALTESLTRLRGRPIELMPLSGPAPSPCGVLISTDRADYIGYAVDTTALHQQHIVLHEIGHLLCAHTGGAGLSTVVSRVLTPQLPDELVRRVLGRSVYTERQEQEAELVASLTLHRALQRPRSTAIGRLADRTAQWWRTIGRPGPRGAAWHG